MQFEVIPAIDLKAGKCVQLVQGVKEHELISINNPLDVATRWIDEGADTLHIIDLDGAFGEENTNTRIIFEILDLSERRGVTTQVGGGIRTVEYAARLLEAGAARIILGTAALENPDFVETLVHTYAAERVMVALDARSGEVQVEGWQKGAGESPAKLAQFFEKIGAGWVLFTNIDVEGLMRGILIDPIVDLISAVNIPVIVAGGVTTIDDIKLIQKSGARGAILGSALYKGKITLTDALNAVKEGRVQEDL
ncbi:MAG: 1-(5-phosphoribosyl)-5-[(5-phosphoribosylamino)methylideneamino] imidazole-4-carboxamide isomerase [Candidatus Syntrophoarchaeum caldarius]|uniref:1-(5-phosphoribosyl)-5-[(5-phosphoribosylamino)methylideneamino] imidazole-4-carboxamide isomerase n=1 Tax=Candidatus Syntropharchaeum caldarium TaxID=1838285 RepID=A0A1F2P9W6_9EURY|nr:MAG: 1-(5-phosphoribosyl)-5-[(5-phosphoribosylamino)methylideneamino] imidazole-4-carboxamide isomerase [Candidatus Syntrophoarchaeum caldarius]